MLLTGRQLTARSALKYGLVDEVVPNEILLEAASEIATGGKRERRQRREELTRLKRLFMENRLGRKIVLGQARKKVIAKTRGKLSGAAQDHRRGSYRA